MCVGELCVVGEVNIHLEPKGVSMKEGLGQYA